MMSLDKDASSPMNSQCSSADAADQFLSTEWNPVILVDQNPDFNRASGLSSYNVMVPLSQGKSNTNTVSKQFQSAIDPQDFPLNIKHGNEKNLKGKKRKSVYDSGALHPDFPKEMSLNVEIEHRINVLPESIKCSNIQDEKKHESGIVAGVTRKPTTEHVEELSQGGDAPKEDYIHMRAKRGQATNSHSLAERVRREKISERMKLLQDLVPGCNKINGKAMMLDEIINYVQSLQRQVEFLSMKLSTVNPELPFDIEQIFSKDILHTQERGLSVFGCGPARSASGPHFSPQLPPQGFMQQEFVMCNMPNAGDMMRPTFPQVSNMTQLTGVWDDELQTVLQMGFIPNPPLTISDPNSTMKTDE